MTKRVRHITGQLHLPGSRRAHSDARTRSAINALNGPLLHMQDRLRARRGDNATQREFTAGKDTPGVWSS